MGYWSNKESSRSGPLSGPGWHQYTVTRALRGSGSRIFKSRSGDPQLLVILEDESGGEATTMFTLSDKAAWTLARFLSRAGFDLDELDAQDVGLKHWESEEFASKKLVGASAWGYCEHEHRGDKTFCEISWKHQEDVPTEVLLAAGVSSSPEDDEADDEDDEIPF